MDPENDMNNQVGRLNLEDDERMREWVDDSEDEEENNLYQGHQHHQLLSEDEEEEEELSGDETDEMDRRCRDFDEKVEVKIENFSQKHHDAYENNVPRFTTEQFTLADRPWSLLLFPLGLDRPTHLSVFLVAEGDIGRRSAKFRFSLKNSKTGEVTHKGATHTFSFQQPDWGFRDFVPLDALLDPESGWSEDDGFSIVVELRMKNASVSHYSSHYTNSRETTGFIGIKNQGATCYMNSLLQALFHLGLFRRSVYKIPTDAATKSIPRALQALFYRLQTSDGPCSTKELTQSFGWDDFESFHQHDVTEFNRVLIDTLETKMKGSPVEGMCEKLFRGQFINYIQCVDVDFKSTRPEYFYDLQLTVENCPNIYASFEKYIESEKLEGDNKYRAEGHGLQEAMRGIDFSNLPDVLELNLSRFKHDFEYDTITKINDRFEFYPVINLKKFLPDDYDKSTVFHLHAVLVHSGTMHGGHYYAYIRPSTGCEWFQFDDETVTKATEKNAIDDNFGHSTNMGYSNAYMLIYVRDSCLIDMFGEVKEGDIPTHLVEKIEQERAEKERKQREKREAAMYMGVQFVSEETLKDHNPEKFDLVDFTQVERERVKKEFNVAELTEYVAHERGIEPERVRLWNWILRKNQTKRVERPLTKFTSTTFEHTNSLRVFIETSTRTEEPFFTPYAPYGAMIFFKFFDLPTGQLSYLGCEVFQETDLASEFLAVARRLLGVPETEELVLMEEIKPSRVDDVPLDQTLRDCELMSGDIIVVEKDYSEEERETFPWPYVADYYSDILNRVEVTFNFEEEQEDREPFSMVFPKTASYDEVAEKVGEKVGWEKDKIQFFSRHHSRVDPRKYVTLGSMLGHDNTKLSIELLDISVHELMLMSIYMVTFVNPDTTKRGEPMKVMLKGGVASDLLDEVKKRLGEEFEKKELRLISVNFSQIDKVLDPDMPLHYVSGTKQLLVEEIPEDELVSEEEEEEEREEEGDEGDDSDEFVSVEGVGKKAGRVLVNFGHFKAASYFISAYGTPFVMKVGWEETVGEVKERVRVKLGIEEKDFEDWKIATVSRTRPCYLADDDILLREYDRSVDYVGFQRPSEEPTYETNRYYRQPREEGIRFKEVKE